MELIRQCEYDNSDLEYWDIVIIDWYRLGMVKSTYYDWNTDCSWHYVKVNKDSEVDIQGSEILYKIVWNWVEIIKNMILTWEIAEDKDMDRLEIQNNINYYEEQIRKTKSDLKGYENLLEEEKDKLKH